MILLAENYRGKYVLNEYGKVINKANVGYGDCTVGNISYFMRLVINRCGDYNITKEFYDKILKDYKNQKLWKTDIDNLKRYIIN